MGMDGTMCVYGVGMRKGMLGFSAPPPHTTTYFGYIGMRDGGQYPQRCMCLEVHVPMLGPP